VAIVAEITAPGNKVVAVRNKNAQSDLHLKLMKYLRVVLLSCKLLVKEHYSIW